jgi:NAD(P)-dependent dehydrogenase (short-subunit alcohol dehydrogenase family)
VGAHRRGSEGVGAEFAQLLAEAGLNLVLVAREAGPLQQTADRCRRDGGEVRTVQVDLSDLAACTRIAAATFGLEVGLLILVAGANTHSHEFLDGDLAEFRHVIDLNLSTPLALVHTADRRCAPGGEAASCCSGRSPATWDRRVRPSTAASGRSQGFRRRTLVGAARPRSRRAGAGPGGHQDEVAAFADAMNPMGRIGDPYLDIAPVVLFLAGEGCRYLTGNTLFVDGGSHINGVAWTPDLDAAP